MIRYYVTDRHQGDVLASVTRAVKNRVEMIQVREKDLPASELLDLVNQIKLVTVGTGTKLLVNDRLDIALASGIDGVHLPGNGLPADRVRRYVPLVGVSVHSVEEALDAERKAANFVVFGPVFATPGKQPAGIEALRLVTEAVRIPVLAIGGITADNTETVMRAGAAGIAAIRLFQED
jgi:thiamine-phosphate pyrophosphorylase